MTTIWIKNCHECPFCNNDNEYGRDWCNMKDIKLPNWKELPSDKVHNECPLLTETYIIELHK